jgi:hypothetical protein
MKDVKLLLSLGLALFAFLATGYPVPSVEQRATTGGKKNIVYFANW